MPKSVPWYPSEFYYAPADKPKPSRREKRHEWKRAALILCGAADCTAAGLAKHYPTTMMLVIFGLVLWVPHHGT
jgi:hypothetical protein